MHLDNVWYFLYLVGIFWYFLKITIIMVTTLITVTTSIIIVIVITPVIIIIIIAIIIIVTTPSSNGFQLKTVSAWGGQHWPPFHLAEVKQRHPTHRCTFALFSLVTLHYFYTFSFSTLHFSHYIAIQHITAFLHIFTFNFTFFTFTLQHHPTHQCTLKFGHFSLQIWQFTHHLTHCTFHFTFDTPHCTV